MMTLTSGVFDTMTDEEEDLLVDAVVAMLERSGVSIEDVDDEPSGEFTLLRFLEPFDRLQAMGP